MKPLISVVIPTYNRSEYLAESLNSVLNQTFKDFEVIVVDDGSNDSTSVLMKYFVKIDPRVKYIVKNQNEGIAKARNLGISHAKGDYISVHDSDDLMLPKKLAKSIRMLKKTKADFVYSSYFISDGDGHSRGMYEPIANITAQQVHDNAAYPHITIVAKRECFIDTPYREELKVNDDTMLVLDWFLKKYKAVRIKEPLCIVRYHNTRISIKKQKEVEEINEEMRQELKKAGYIVKTKSNS